MPLLVADLMKIETDFGISFGAPEYLTAKGVPVDSVAPRISEGTSSCLAPEIAAKDTGWRMKELAKPKLENVTRVIEFGFLTR